MHRSDRIALPLQAFYEAEEYHQDYLIKNPNGYCHIDIKKADEPLPDKTAFNGNAASRERFSRQTTIWCNSD